MGEEMTFLGNPDDFAQYNLLVLVLVWVLDRTERMDHILVLP
jgi:hypothetical protein